MQVNPILDAPPQPEQWRHQHTLLDKFSRDRCKHRITAFSANPTGLSCKRSVKIISPLIKPILYLPVRSDSTNIKHLQHAYLASWCLTERCISPCPREEPPLVERKERWGNRSFPKLIRFILHYFHV